MIHFWWLFLWFSTGCRISVGDFYSDEGVCREGQYSVTFCRCQQWQVISLFGLVLSISGITTCTHRPQEIVIVAIYMSSNIYYLLLLYLSVHREIGCSKWKKTLAYLLVLPGSRARIVRCGKRYDPQLVKRSSEWVSEFYMCHCTTGFTHCYDTAAILMDSFSTKFTL